MASTKQTQVIKTANEVRKWSRKCQANGESVALVPTMGFLHEGHLSLVKAASQRADKVVVSIYVNEAQFAPGEDLTTYPRDPQGDLDKLEGLCDIIFTPAALYPPADPCSGTTAHQTFVEVHELQKPLCGITRPIFFRGVATVVAKLFNMCDPNVAVFGRKDYQQWRVITQMVQDLDFPVEVVGMPLVRESDGLAMSSRNVRLSSQERQNALCINQGLLRAQEAATAGESNTQILCDTIKDNIAKAEGIVDYVEAVDAFSLEAVKTISNRPVVIAVAAKFGNVRLLDNIEVKL